MGFKQIRLGTYNDKTRLVFDGSDAELPLYKVEGRDTDILVSWGEMSTANADEKQSEQVAEPVTEQVAKPVVENPPVAAKKPSCLRSPRQTASGRVSAPP